MSRVKTNILRLIQNWSIAFEGKPALNYVGQVYKTLITEGCHASEAGFSLPKSVKG
ncbi:hypothetical protein BYT27DRAFT_7181570 [Phlegmacium glaucopus]|nr:hypothetical protein BYT27DRAFT_7181570 [Phlegmacium glaucopus]